ncbi:hypothetical protein [Ligilactobacillus murinus]|uniref:Uncharacterized protein n=1 Tax=Ligilactobacillus murinus TaxID=1622 RepID=A0AAE6WJI1_9LACO|nr:hypothetical protein [Ligilactobacillus murinus]NEF82822.1 hypothetical protein [Ligilactobacillus murinus]NEF85547.1 hypothetical protein [Ligilactobacillus murinus]NEF87402.1 hypothetical protein [Ligilactobacillus murinus]NEF89707.1 hypothetical protein [Ligilactobacillus murinus]NEF91989.1 hypothetical protein [Ligilactobacillus murinus]
MEKQVNKFIQPDPQAMDKVPAQMMIYDGQAWLEISNQQTINEFGQITTDLRKDANETMLYVQKVEDDFKRAGDDILNEIDRETTRLDKSIADAKLDTKNVDQRVTEINSRNQQKAEEIKNNLTLIDKKIDDTANQSQQSLNKMKTDVSVQLQAKSVEIVEAKKQAIENAETALKEFQTTVTTKFEDTDGKISQMVTQTEYDTLTKQVDSNVTRINQNQHAIELKADKTTVDEANTKISDLSSSLTVVNDAIKAKAGKTDVDKLSGRVAKTEASLNLTNQQIQLKADSSAVNELTKSVDVLKQSALTVDSDKIKGLTSEVERTNQRITDTHTLTEQNANTIRTLATKEELSTVTQKFSLSKSELSQTIEGIRASVTTVDGKLNNLSVGGKNLLKQSQLGANYAHDAWYAAFGGVTWNSDTVELNVGNKDCVQIEQRVYDVEPDSDYVFSFDLNYADAQHLDKQGFIFWEFQDREGKHTTRAYRDNWTSMAKIPNTPGRKDKKIVIHTQPDTHMLIFMVKSLKGATQPFRISKVKFEKGKIPTDYTVAPEDTDNKLNGLESNYASLDVKINGINTTVATKADKSYVDQKAGEINSVVANKADISYVDQKASQWQVALQNLDNTVSGKITATKQDLASLYESETYKGMQKIVQNSAFLQNANGFTTQVQSMVSDELKQINLVYNSEFESGNGQEIDGWIASHPIKRGTNMYDNYYGSTSLGMWTFDNATDQWVNAWSQMIDVNEGDHLSASVVAFYTGGIVSTPLGGCGIEIELFEREGVNRKTWSGNYEDIVNIPWGHEKTIRIDDYTIPSGITKARIGLVIKGKGNVMFAHPMLVKGRRAGIYQPSVVNKLSKLTQTLDGLKSEVHDSSINSVIGQTARMIALQISGDKNKVISQINASPEGVMIDGKHIMINGNTRIQGTLMVNDVVMKSQSSAVKFSPESLDMVGANSMLRLQSDAIRLGAVSSDPRQQWGVGLDKNGLAFTIPVKQLGSTANNPSDYRQEIQGYINGGGWDYTKADTVGNGASGIEIGLMTKQTWGEPYGGDYIAIGQYTPTNTAKTSKAFSPAISYSETGFGWAPQNIHMYKPTTFHSDVHMNVSSTGYGIRTAWVSWSDWNNEKYPCFVNDTGNWGGIAFPSNGNVIMFNSAGKRFNIYETKDKHYDGYGVN